MKFWVTLALSACVCSFSSASVQPSNHDLVDRQIERVLEWAQDSGVSVPAAPSRGFAVVVLKQGAGYVDLTVLASPREDPKALAELLDAWLSRAGLHETVKYSRTDDNVAARFQQSHRSFPQNGSMTKVPLGALLSQLRATHPKVVAVAEVPQYANCASGRRLGAKEDQALYDLSAFGPGEESVVAGSLTKAEVGMGTALLFLPLLLTVLGLWALAHRKRLLHAPHRRRSSLWGEIPRLPAWLPGPVVYLLVIYINDSMPPTSYADVWFGSGAPADVRSWFEGAVTAAFLGAVLLATMMMEETTALPAPGESNLGQYGRPFTSYWSPSIVFDAVWLSIYAFLLPHPWTWVTAFAVLATLAVVRDVAARRRSVRTFVTSPKAINPEWLTTVAAGARLANVKLKAFRLTEVGGGGQFLLPVVQASVVTMSSTMVTTLNPDELRYVTCWSCYANRTAHDRTGLRLSIPVVYVACAVALLSWQEWPGFWIVALVPAVLYGLWVRSYILRDPRGLFNAHVPTLKAMLDVGTAKSLVESLYRTGQIDDARWTCAMRSIDRAAEVLRNKGCALSEGAR